MTARPARDPFSAPTTAVRQGTTKQSPPTPVDAPSVEQLLAQADACPLESVQKLAGQIRTAVEQLRTKLEEVAAFTATQRELDDAVARVEQLRAKLATLGPVEEPLPSRGVPSKRTTSATTKALLAAAAPASSAVNGKDIRYSSAVRDWARSHGMQVAPNGRIADSIIDAYLAAHR